MEVEKAFDRCWYRGIMYKMIQAKIPPYIIHFVRSYLKDRTFNVWHQNKNSSNREIKAGVPQGSLLGPVLFLLYVNDIPKCPKTEIAMYADDTIIYSSSFLPNQVTKYIQEHLNILKPWLKRWKIKVNASKCEAIQFTKRRRNPDKQLILNRTKIDWVKKVKYLRVTLDRKLNFAQHTRIQAGKAHGRLFQLSALFKCPALNTQSKLTLYKMLVRPIITYAAPSWAHTANCHINRLKRVQYRAIRLILGLNRFIPVATIQKELGLHTIKEYIKNLTRSFYSASQNNPNRLVSTLGTYTPKMPYKYSRPLHILKKNPYIKKKRPKNRD